MREEEDEKVGVTLPVVGHGRANLSTDCANILDFWVVLDRRGLARPCQGSGHWPQNFSFCLNHLRTITYKIT